jgi:hypothetical protein
VSIETIHAALIAAVTHDSTLKTVKDADTPPLVTNLPAGAVWYIGDGQGEVPTQRVFRFGVRLFVALTDLSRAQAQLYPLITTLASNLEAHRDLTAATERITIFDGTVDPLQWPTSTGELGPMFLGYTTTVTVEPRPAYQVVLAVGADTVTLVDCDRESLPLTEAPMEVLNDVYGVPTVYIRTDRLQLVALAGRVNSTVEALRLVDWYTDGTAISYTDRHGTTSTGWTIAGTPTPRAESRATASATYDVAITLYKLP